MNEYKILALVPNGNERQKLIKALEHGDYECMFYSDHAEFLRAVETERFDLCLIALDTTVSGSLGILSKVRTAMDHGIVVVTGSDDPIDIILGLEMGADDCLPNSYNGRELLARLKAVVRLARRCARSSMQDATTEDGIYSSRYFKVHRNQRTVFKPDGQVLDLGQIEYDLLMILISSANQVLTRAEIMTRLRGPGWSAHERAIDGLVSKLRSKLFPESLGRTIITTIRGRGYIFRDIGDELEVALLPAKAVCMHCAAALAVDHPTPPQLAYAKPGGTDFGTG